MTEGSMRLGRGTSRRASIHRSGSALPLFANIRATRHERPPPQTGLTVAGLFAGIGGIELGLHRAGHRTVLLCENDPGAVAVLGARFPEVPLEKDVRLLTDMPKVDLLAAGFPCQDLSQAGTTRGIDGDRSRLVGQVFRLLLRRPVQWVLLENVPFMLQLAKGRALEVIVSKLELLGYNWAYRVVDSHELRNFRTGSKKNLDLVICRPRSESSASAAKRRTFEQRGEEIGAILSPEARSALKSLPTLKEFPVGAVHLAVEAKACMTAFGKARPRLYDELNSSHQVVHGNSDHTIAAGHAIVNCADEFISPSLNDFPCGSRDPIVSKHVQPRDAVSVIEKLSEIPRRAREGEEGFDALAITVIRCRNDGSRVELVETWPAPQPGEIHHYEWTIHRLAQLYEQKFRAVGEP